MTGSHYRVLAVAASADALPAVEALLAALPDGLPLPVAVACERDPDERDALLRRLQAASRLPVVEPDDKDDLERGRVYLAPAGYHLVLDGGSAALACDEERPPSASALFESAADSYGPAAAAVSFGEGADVAQALAQVRAAGGLALDGGPEAIAQILEALRGGAGKDDRGRRD